MSFGGVALGLSIAAATALLVTPAVRQRGRQLRMLATSSSSSALTGALFRFKNPSWPAPLQAFESPAGHSHSNVCVYVGGLTDGLLACAYVESMAAELDKCGWALVQPVLSSSYAGYGCSSLSRDAEELAELLATIDRRSQAKAFAIVGHSTGCQDAVALLRIAPPEIRAKIRAAVLQAPVSDRESNAVEPDVDGSKARLLAEAERLVAAGKGDQLLSEKHYGFVPMSAQRYASLAGRNGSDDMFSSDLSDEELALRLGHMGTQGQREGIPSPAAGTTRAKAAVGIAPQSADGAWLVEPVAAHPGLRTIFAHSGDDEYVPSTVDVTSLSRRFVAAAGGAANGAEAVIIAGANHNLARPPAAADDFVACVSRVLSEVCSP